MGTSTKHDHPVPEKAAATIIKHLERCTSAGVRPSQIFEDWLAIVEATLDMEPVHLRSLATTGKFADDPPDVVALWERLRDRYRQPDYFERFATAYAELKATTLIGYQDTLGQIYMAWGYPNDRLGQFFTPYNVAKLMAQMTVDAREIDRRLKAAIAQSPAAEAALLAGLALDGEQALAWFIARVIPLAIQQYEPVTINEPCVGSGVMLLAAAECYPDWAVALGLVRFTGTDLDPTCVQMARINCKLYGLNGSRAEQVLAQAEAILSELGKTTPTAEPPVDAPATTYEQAAFSF